MMIIFSNESVHGERANVTGLVLGLIEADFSDEILTGIGIGIWKALTAIYTIHFDLQFFFSMKCCRILSGDRLGERRSPKESTRK